jgi:hypothetical protein
MDLVIETSCACAALAARKHVKTKRFIRKSPQTNGTNGTPQPESIPRAVKHKKYRIILPFFPFVACKSPIGQRKPEQRRAERSFSIKIEQIFQDIRKTAFAFLFAARLAITARIFAPRIMFRLRTLSWFRAQSRFAGRNGDNLVQFAPIQPNPATARAIVKLHTAALGNDKQFSVNWTFHSRTFPEFLTR